MAATIRACAPEPAVRTRDAIDFLQQRFCQLLKIERARQGVRRDFDHCSSPPLKPPPESITMRRNREDGSG
jgi:hypothetical protein